MATWYHPPERRPPGWKGPAIAVLAALGIVLLFLIGRASRKHRPIVALTVPTAPELQISSGTIRAGGTLARSLSDAGLSAEEIGQIERSLRPYLDPRKSHPNDVYEVFRSSDGALVKLRYWPNRFEDFLVRTASGAYVATLEKAPTTESLAGVAGTLQDSLWRAMIRQEVPPEMINRFAELFGWRFDFLTEPRVGDTFKMVWKRQSGNGAIRDGDILCAYYHSRDRGDFFAFPLAGDYFDQNGESLRGEFLRAPLVYRRISSRFTNRRFHPILRYWRPHHGIDYSAPAGTPASSIGDGVIIEMLRGYNRGLGNEVRIRHAGSYVSVYGHLLAFARGLHAGSHVHQGQVIGYVGSTGLSTGPHLHFGFESGGRMINFLTFKTSSRRKSVPPPERANFSAIKQNAMGLLERLNPAGSGVQALTTAPAPSPNR